MQMTARNMWENLNCVFKKMVQESEVVKGACIQFWLIIAKEYVVYKPINYAANNSKTLHSNKRGDTF